MLAACSGRDVPARASDAFVEKTFDSFAASFDAKLASLGYRAPALVAEMLAHAGLDASRSLDVLDAGCGTGLCGPLVAPYARRLVGVDLSEAMLARARARDVYDELVKGELTAYLRDCRRLVRRDRLRRHARLLRPARRGRRGRRRRAPSRRRARLHRRGALRRRAGTSSARTAATATRPAMSSARSRLPASGRRSSRPSCASKPASRSRGSSCAAPRRALDAWPAVRGGERGGVETFGGVERSLGLLRGVASERAAQQPPAAEPDEVQAVVGRVGRALGLEIEVHRQLLGREPDRRGRRSTGRDQRGDHLQLAHTRADLAGRERARGDHHPRHPGEAGARNAAHAAFEAVGGLVDHAVERVLLSGERVTSAAEGKRLLAGDVELEARADQIQRVVVAAVPRRPRAARGARFTRVPWVMVASSAVTTGVAVRTGVRELQVLASLVAHRLEQTTGAPADPALVRKLAIDLYLDPKRTPDLGDDGLRLVRLSRRWLLSGAFGRNTSKQAAKALDAAERLDAAALAAGDRSPRRLGGLASSARRARRGPPPARRLRAAARPGRSPAAKPAAASTRST